MQILEQKNFINTITPFNRLEGFDLEQLCAKLDIIYFKKDEIIFKSGEKPKFLYFIIKGVVQEKDKDEVVSIYTNNEYFDPISLIENSIKSNFIAIEETICYILPREIFLDTIYKNRELESFFFQSISKKLNTLTHFEQSKELVNFMVARVKEAFLQKPIILDENETIYNSVKILKKEQSSCILVKKREVLGIVTDTDFKEKVILNRIDFDEPISKIATFGIVTVDIDEFLFNAQIKMNKYGIKRVVVTKDNSVVGILDIVSLTSFFASHTYSVILELDNVKNIDELKKASAKFIRVVKALHAKGVKVRYISKIITQLNNKLFAKLFNLLAPKDLKTQAALIVMGSEGRGEQILRTDQDNALILSNNCDIAPDVIEKFANDFTKHLIDMGYPKCDGNIMISNKFWRKTEAEFNNIIEDWVNSTNEQNLIYLAIFYDAICVAGDKDLLKKVKDFLLSKTRKTGIFYTFFAKPILNFPTPLSMFANFVFDKKEHKNELDIKKGGIFPIVHGIRSLALEYNIKKTNTVDRIKEINNLEIIDREFASELIESFTFLLYIRLKFRLKKIDFSQKLDNYINPNELNVLERDLLKDSFKIVNKFKKFISHHFDLERLI